MATILNIIYVIELILFICFSMEWVQARNRKESGLQHSMNMLIISILMFITTFIKTIIK